MSFRFNEYNYDLENFFETQRVFSFLENNLYMIYCLFPHIRDYSFYILVFIYIILIPIFQFILLMIVLLLTRIFKLIFKMKQDFKGFHVMLTNDMNIISLIFLNNFITLFYYFIGLVFFFTVNKQVSINFMELSFDSGEFYIILFSIVLPISILFIVPIIFFMKKYQSFEQMITILDCPYREGWHKISIFSYFVLFFTIIFSHYSFIRYSFSVFVKNMFMLYLPILTTFKILKFKIVKYIKLVSTIVIIVTFFQNFTAIIVLNSLFYAFLTLFALKIFFSEKSSLFDVKISRHTIFKRK